VIAVLEYYYILTGIISIISIIVFYYGLRVALTYETKRRRIEIRLSIIWPILDIDYTDILDVYTVRINELLTNGKYRFKTFPILNRYSQEVVIIDCKKYQIFKYLAITPDHAERFMSAVKMNIDK